MQYPNSTKGDKQAKIKYKKTERCKRTKAAKAYMKDVEMCRR